MFKAQIIFFAWLIWRAQDRPKAPRNWRKTAIPMFS